MIECSYRDGTPTGNGSPETISEWASLLKIIESGGRDATRRYVENSNEISNTDTGRCILDLLDSTEEQTARINSSAAD